MVPGLSRSAAVLLAALSTGCALAGGGPAAIYHHTVVPLDVNATGLELGEDHRSRSTIRVDPNAYISVEFGNAGIGDVARAFDFVTIDHADLEVLSILGVYTQRFVHIYGTRLVQEEPTDEGDGGAGEQLDSDDAPDQDGAGDPDGDPAEDSEPAGDGPPTTDGDGSAAG